MIFITWLIFAALVGLWSSNKLGSFAKGFFVSLLLSPVIGILYVIASRSHYICQHCGYESSASFDFCPICGKNKFGRTLDEMRSNYYTNN